MLRRSLWLLGFAVASQCISHAGELGDPWYMQNVIEGYPEGAPYPLTQVAGLQVDAVPNQGPFLAFIRLRFGMGTISRIRTMLQWSHGEFLFSEEGWYKQSSGFLHATESSGEGKGPFFLIADNFLNWSIYDYGLYLLDLSESVPAVLVPLAELGPACDQESIDLFTSGSSFLFTTTCLEFPAPMVGYLTFGGANSAELVDLSSEGARNVLSFAQISERHVGLVHGLEKDGGIYDLVYSEVQGDQFETLTQISAQTSETKLAIDDEGKPHIGFINDGILSWEFLQDSVLHTQEITLSTDFDFVSLCAFAIDPNGEPQFIAFAADPDDSTRRSILHIFKADDSWHFNPLPDDLDNLSGADIEAVFDSNGYPHVAYIYNGSLTYATTERNSESELADAFLDSFGSIKLLTVGLDSSGANSWLWSPKFGYFHAGFAPWLYHGDLGWLYWIPAQSKGMHLYDSKLGWLWTSEGAYPALYSFDRASWLWFNGGNPESREFIDLTTGELIKN